jgi:hypothetical protein
LRVIDVLVTRSDEDVHVRVDRVMAALPMHSHEHTRTAVFAPQIELHRRTAQWQLEHRSMAACRAEGLHEVTAAEHNEMWRLKLPIQRVQSNGSLVDPHCKP